MATTSSGGRTAKKPWHICDDCIDPLAKRLREIVLKWNRLGSDPPAPNRIEWLYKDCRVELAINWLKLNVSVDFAKDFEEKLFAPLQQFRRLEYRACQVLEGGLDCTSEPTVFYRNAIRRILDERYDWLRQNLHPDDNYDLDKDVIFCEIGDPYTEIEQAFGRAVKYLGEVSAILRAKSSKRSAVEDRGGKGKRGTKKTKNRKIDVAITLIVRNPELSDAAIAREAHCNRSYLTKSREYQNHANMARRAMARLPKSERAAYDARTRQVHPTATDPEVDC